MSFRRLLALVTTACHAIAASCHGYLDMPAARNVQRNSNHCPHCLNGPGLCGDPARRRDHETGGKFASPPRVAHTYRSGSKLDARVVITANHAGRWSLELCSLDNGIKHETKSCFKRLQLADGRGQYVYLSPSAGVSRSTFRIPRGLRCKRCVLRWFYETGNSCTPRGTPRKFANPGLQTCGTRRAPAMETFTNCADIRII